MTSLKITVLGAGSVGKSALSVLFCNGIFVDRYDPTIEDSYRRMVDLDGKQYMLEILDTAGTEHFTAMRDMYIKNGNGFMLIYSVTSESSFSELQEIRNQIVELKGENIALLLVGNKIDLEAERLVSTEQGQSLAKSWKCPFIETSAKLNINVDEAFCSLIRKINQGMKKSNNNNNNTLRNENHTSNDSSTTSKPRSASVSAPPSKKKLRCTIL